MDNNQNIDIFIGDYSETNESQKSKVASKSTKHNSKYFEIIEIRRLNIKPTHCNFCEKKLTEAFVYRDNYSRSLRRAHILCSECMPDREQKLERMIDSGIDVEYAINVKLKKIIEKQKEYNKYRKTEKKVETKHSPVRNRIEELPPLNSTPPIMIEVEQTSSPSDHPSTSQSVFFDTADIINDDGLNPEALELLNNLSAQDEVTDEELASPIATALSSEEIHRRLDITMQVAKKFRLFADRVDFYKIIGSKAHFKLLVTGKGVGKTTNPALFQILYIMLWKEGHFIWIWRNSKDGLRKGKESWERALKLEMPSKKIPSFDLKDWKDSRGMVATEQGIFFKKIRRVYFATLHNYKDLEGKLMGDAIHYVFDEATPSDGKTIEDEPAEPSRWAISWNNVMRVRKWLTHCYFLSNPHAKGIWWLKEFLPQTWIEEAFGHNKPSGQKHLFDSTEPKYASQPEFLEWQKQKIEKFGLKFSPNTLLYQAPELEGEFGTAFNLIETSIRHEEGRFASSEEDYLIEKPVKYRQKMLYRGCVLCEYKVKGQLKYFFYRKQTDEALDPKIMHLCSSTEEYLQSDLKRKYFPEKASELREENMYIVNLLEKGRLGFCDPDKYRAKQIILQAIDKLTHNL